MNVLLKVVKRLLISHSFGSLWLCWETRDQNTRAIDVDWENVGNTKLGEGGRV